MRRAFGLVSVALTLAIVTPASAGPDCVTYSVSAPIVGNRAGTRCVPGVFTQPFSFGTCHTVPPIQTQACIDVTIHTP
jgi:hypothetical protein